MERFPPVEGQHRYMGGILPIGGAPHWSYRLVENYQHVILPSSGITVWDLMQCSKFPKGWPYECIASARLTHVAAAKPFVLQWHNLKNQHILQRHQPVLFLFDEGSSALQKLMPWENMFNLSGAKNFFLVSGGREPHFLLRDDEFPLGRFLLVSELNPVR